jgi:diguanylate cyclase (GGDEF)-like protein
VTHAFQTTHFRYEKMRSSQPTDHPLRLPGKFHSLIQRTSAELLPSEIFVSLIDDLYAPGVSFAIGAVTAALAGGIAAWRTGSVVLAILTVCAAAVAAGRVVTILQYRRRKATIAGDQAALRRWERWYAAGAWAYGACIGGMCLVTFVFADDPVSQVLLTGMALGYTAGVTARNASRPRIALAQLSLILLPITIGSALHGGYGYATLSLITFLYYLAAIEIVQFLARHRLRLLTTSREKRELAHSLAEQNLRFDAALNNMAQGLCMFGPDQRLLFSNRRFAEIFGIPPDRLAPGVPIGEVMAFARARDKNPEFAANAQRKLLTEDPNNMVVTTLTDDRIIAISHRGMPNGGMVATFDDITEQREAEQRIAFLARHDALTGLANRVLFHETLIERLGRVQKGETVAVLSLDLDRFKSVNEEFGHPVGDKVLQAVAKRIRSCIRDEDVVARLGGDEFAVVQVAPASEAGALASRLIEALGASCDIDGNKVFVGASIGIAIAPMDGAAPDALMKNADLALHRAKADGGAVYHYFEAEMDARMRERRVLELDLRKAIVSGEFELYYQPIIDLRTGQITSCEALIRWRHPQRGLVSPLDFIPIAEEIGVIVPLGEWALQEACQQAARWPKHVTVAINVSPAQFKGRNFVQTVVDALAASGMEASRIQLEITELVLLEDNQKSFEILHQLHDLGIKIVMDDFGTGYSSLGYLRSFPFDKIKIDQSFIRDLATKSESVAIVRAVVGLSSSLGIVTTAEGVETKEQLERVTAEGCKEAQGFLFSPPRPATEIIQLLGDAAPDAGSVAA